VSKIRLTGGEPTLRRDIVELAGRLSSIPGVQALGITSNGIALKRKLADLKANGVTPL
jgi:GTP 3',8-cyclase